MVGFKTPVNSSKLEKKCYPAIYQTLAKSEHLFPKKKALTLNLTLKRGFFLILMKPLKIECLNRVLNHKLGLPYQQSKSQVVSEPPRFK